MNFNKVFFLLVSAFLITTSVFAQLMVPGSPPSYDHPGLFNTIETVELNKPDLVKYMAEDAENEEMGFPSPPRMGVSVAADIDVENTGEWTALPDGSQVWLLKIVYPDALAIGVNFDEFFIPEGGQLYFYNEDRTMVSGAFTSESNTPLGTFSSDFIQGDILYIEYLKPSSPGLDPVLSISEIIYAYRDIWFNFSRGERGGSWPCMINVACEEGEGWEAQGKGVTRISIKIGYNYYWCSGSLINNTSNDRTPYVLSASHCSEGASSNDYTYWKFYFNYEASYCGGNGGSSSEFRTGCTFKAKDPTAGDDGSDFLLVQINQAIPATYDVYLNGWNRTNVPAADTGVSIHHPAGDIKKISTHWQMISSAWWNGLSSHWRVLWATTVNGPNTVQGGSSGSPVFDEEGYILGDLTGGYTSNSCSNPSPAWYGKIWYSWDQNGTTPTTRLKDWLDPDDTGIEKLQGIYQAVLPPQVDFSADNTQIRQADSVRFTDETTGNPSLSWLWVFEGGTPDTSYEQNPTVKYYGYGEFDVSLTVTNADGTSTETKADYITVEQILPPDADFEADVTQLLEGEEVNFTDLSTNSPETWMWVFEGAVPDTSWEQDPQYIEYPDPGSFDVTLVAGNLGGADTLVRVDYIMVEPGVAPISDFMADATQIMVGDTVNFTDLTTGDPTRWTWSFEGGDPTSAYTQHPGGIVYLLEGAYDVQLKAQNAYGSHTTLKEDYILVGTVTVSEINRQKGVAVYPNPTRGNLNIRLTEESGDLNVKIFNASGALVNSIATTSPVNSISIDMSGLIPGFYFLKIETEGTIISRKISLSGM